MGRPSWRRDRAEIANGSLLLGKPIPAESGDIGSPREGVLPLRKWGPSRPAGTGRMHD
jgi:hypothetical protein